MASSTDQGATCRTLTRIAVIIPAHNEEHLIEACLQAVDHAAQALTDAMDSPPKVITIVVLDDCDDATAHRLADRPGIITIAVRARCVGAARSAGADAALHDVSDPSQVWLANTDADSAVPRHWLASMASHARGGSDLVLGTVRPAGGPHPAVIHRWARRYSPVEGHPHIHGANLGINGAAYRRLGGWPHLTTGEDVALIRRAETAGFTITRTAAAPVTTSSRLSGRAPDGFAAYLTHLHHRADDVDPLFPNAAQGRGDLDAGPLALTSPSSHVRAPALAHPCAGRDGISH